jgi:hypothetical protein
MHAFATNRESRPSAMPVTELVDCHAPPGMTKGSPVAARIRTRLPLPLGTAWRRRSSRWQKQHGSPPDGTILPPHGRGDSRQVKGRTGDVHLAKTRAGLLHNPHAKRGPTLLSAPTAPGLAIKTFFRSPEAVSRLCVVRLLRRERLGRRIRFGLAVAAFALLRLSHRPVKTLPKRPASREARFQLVRRPLDPGPRSA